jgi:hypothetical protein
VSEHRTAIPPRNRSSRRAAQILNGVNEVTVPLEPANDQASFQGLANKHAPESSGPILPQQQVRSSGGSWMRDKRRVTELTDRLLLEIDRMKARVPVYPARAGESAGSCVSPRM